MSYSRSDRRRQLRRHRVATGIFHQPAETWMIQSPNGENDLYSAASTEAEAWSRFLTRAIGKRVSYKQDGWKAVKA